MGLSSLIKREIAITVGTVILVSTIFVMFSYAIFKVEATAETDTIKFGDISLKMCVNSKCDSEINNQDNVIGLVTASDGTTKHVPIYPTADPTSSAEWANLSPYTFQLTNNGDLDLYITVLLEKDTTGLSFTETSTYPGGTISNTYTGDVDETEVKIGFAEGSATPTIQLYSDTLDSADNTHKIAKNILIKKGETKTYNLYAYLKSDAANASQGKIFVTNITVRGEYLPA